MSASGSADVEAAVWAQPTLWPAGVYSPGREHAGQTVQLQEEVATVW